MRPDCARHFAAALGLLVKTDHLDPSVVARYGRLEGLEATAPLHLALAQLQDPVLARRRLVDESASLRRREQERDIVGLAAVRGPSAGAAPAARQRNLSGNRLTRCYRLWTPVVPQRGQHAWTARVDPTRLPNRVQRNEKVAPGSAARPSH